MGYYLLDNPNPNAPQYAYPRRGGRKPSGTIIVHTAEGNGRTGVARFIANRSDYGSYHRLSDETGTTKLLPFEYEAWQDTETNGWGIGISAACCAADWKRMAPAKADAILRNLAKAAAEAVEYMRAAHGVNVPIRRISGAQARAGVPGFCAHGDSGHHRSDPGKDFDWDLFFTYVNQELSGIYTASAPTQDWFDTLDEKTLRRIIHEETVAYKGAQDRDVFSFVVNSSDEAAHKTVREHIRVTDTNGKIVDAQLAAFIGTIWKQVHRNAPKQFKEIVARLGSIEAMLAEVADGGDLAAVTEASKAGALAALQEWERDNVQEIAIAVVDEQAERLAPKQEAK